MSRHVFNNFDQLFTIIVIYIIIIIKLNQLNDNNNDIIYFYCKHSAEEIITRNNFQSINSLLCLITKGRHKNKQRINKNLVFNHLLIFLNSIVW